MNWLEVWREKNRRSQSQDQLVGEPWAGRSISLQCQGTSSISLSLHLKTYFSLSVCIYAAGRCKRDSSLVPFSAHFVRFYPGIHSSVVKGAQNQHRPRNHFIHGWFLAFWFLQEFWFLSPQFHLVQVQSVVSTLGAVSTIFSFTCQYFLFFKSSSLAQLREGDVIKWVFQPKPPSPQLYQAH